MMSDFELARLRRLASAESLPPDVPVTFAGQETRAIIAAALAEIESARRVHSLTPPIIVSGTQRIDDERFRRAGENKALDRLMWQGVAREIGEKLLAHIDCRVATGSGLVTFSAAGVVLGSPENPDAKLSDFGGFRVRVTGDNRGEPPPPPTLVIMPGKEGGP